MNEAPTLATSCASLPPEGARFPLGRPGGETKAPTLATSCASLPPEGARFALGRPGGETCCLWLVRHAQPLVASGVCYGRSDMAADADATTACAQALAPLLPDGTRVVTSPLQRCAQLAAALQALRPDLHYTCDARLQEMDFGAWEGQAWAAIAPAELQAWTDDFAHFRPGGSGESVTAFMARVGQAFDAVRESAATLWITHAGVMRAVELLAGGTRQILRADQWPVQAPAYGQWRTLDLST